MKNLVAGVLLVGSFSIAAVGCGGSDGNNNIVGTWNMTEVCADKSVFMEAFVGGLMGECPAANVGAVTFTPSGSMVFNADNSYSINLGISGSIVINIPTSCIQGATCADLGAALAASFADDPTVQSASCSGSSTCACTVVMVPDQSSEAGTYSVSGSTLLTTPTGATVADSMEYCVKGKTVTFPAPPMTAMDSGIVALVAVKP